MPRLRLVALADHKEESAELVARGIELAARVDYPPAMSTLQGTQAMLVLSASW